MRSRVLTTCSVAAVTLFLLHVPLQSTPEPDDSQTFLQGAQQPIKPVSPADGQRVRDLVARMTLKEKVGQMTQFEIGMVTDGQEGGIRINPQKLKKAINDYGVGSIINVKDVALSPAKWRELVEAIQQAAQATRLRIPVIYGLDSIHGANYVAGATHFPQPLGMAATWDPALMRDASAVTAAETRAMGVHWNFSPVLDVGRQVLWPRLFETFGEDPYVTSVMGAASVRGYQGDDPAAPTRVAASLKHYVGYSAPLSGRDRSPALIPEITLREYYLPPFAAAIKAGALSVMVNSGEVNGIPGHANKWLLTDVLRKELGFEGVVVSDWEDIKKLATIHRSESTEKDATRTAILAGVDMSMVPSDYSFSDLLVQLVNEGSVPMTRVNDAVSRILTMKARVGLFREVGAPRAPIPSVGTAANREVALRAARESIVLAKNAGGVLPLASSARVLVTGPTADSLPALNNGWTITWQGNRPDLFPAGRPTVRRALEQRLGSRASYVAGTSFDAPIDIAAAAAAAASADLVVLCLGELSYAETPGNLDDLSLPDAQLRLAEAIIGTGKPVVLVMIEGRPRIIRTIADRVAGVLVAFNPGSEGGTAIADILAGEINPSGRLPITYPRYVNALLTYDHKAFEEQDTSFGNKAFQPQFEFGSGLSYTTFEYSGLTVPSAAPTFAGGVDVSVTVRNNGKRAGTDVVQLYVSDRVASVPPPVKRLRRFERVDLAPGASRQVTFRLTRDDLSFIGPRGRMTEPGTFTILVGGLSKDVAVH